MASEINRMMGPDTAEALDAVSISVLAPTDTAQKVAYLAELENIEVSKANSAAKIIVNARSGTIVIGSEVVVKPAAVATGSLTVTIDESFAVSQPGLSRRAVKPLLCRKARLMPSRKRPSSSSWKAASIYRTSSQPLIKLAQRLVTSSPYSKRFNRLAHSARRSS